MIIYYVIDIVKKKLFVWIINIIYVEYLVRYQDIQKQNKKPV